MKVRSVVAAVSIGLLAVAVGTAPTLVTSASTAAFSDSVTLGSNVATAATCTTATAWSSAVSTAFIGAARVEWQTLDTSTAAVPNDAWNNDNWSESSLVTNQSGAAYCSSNRAISLDAASDLARSPAKTYATWTASSTLTTLVWVKTASTIAGRVISLAEAASGGSAYAERVLWMTSTGGLVAGGRYASGSAWTASTTDATVNDGRWHLLSVVWTNTATVNAAPSIFIDGVPSSTTTTGTVTYRARSSSGTSAAWYLGTNSAGRSPTGAPTQALIGSYDEFIVVAGTPSATLLGAGTGSLYRAADL